ncbi:hypothetical protein [uncultured Rubinisphaera sp.]|uniref:hypothetical protein n=1 Tax=uncultured Rubinisphaera sp. TaxID=1678686 RepID=UPI0030D91089|tara:strand:- start:349 stop:573 length:225 start_codon:yes stop_codon:yes gene_type:complete
MSPCSEIQSRKKTLLGLPSSDTPQATFGCNSPETLEDIVQTNLEPRMNLGSLWHNKKRRPEFRGGVFSVVNWQN